MRLIVLCCIILLTSSCAHSKLEQWEGGKKTLEVSTFNMFTGRGRTTVASGNGLDTYETGIESTGASDNLVEIIESKPVSSAATSIGKAATGTSAIGTSDLGGVVRDRLDRD